MGKVIQGQFKQISKKVENGFRGFPMATVAFYGPNSEMATKVAVGIIKKDGGDVDPLECWFSETSDVRNNQQIEKEILQFVVANHVKTVATTDGIIGCPHQEGLDYPEGSYCPQCPYWIDRDPFTLELNNAEDDEIYDEEYSDEGFEQVEKQVDEWYELFMKSPEYGALNDVYRKYSEFVISIFGSNMYSYHLEKAGHWSALALSDVCKEVIPRKVADSQSFFEAIEPVLKAFFKFLDAKGLISNAGELVDEINGTTDEIVGAALDPMNWGMAKSLFMGATSGDVDLSDEADINEYIARSFAEFADQENDIDDQNLAVPFRRQYPKIGRNDLCYCNSGKKFKRCCYKLQPHH